MGLFSSLALIATVAGAGMQIAGANKARQEAERAQRAELARQSEYRKRAQVAFQKSLERSTPEVAEQSIKKGGNQRQQDYARARSVPLTDGQVPFTSGDASRLVSPTASAGQDRLSDAVRARLAGYTDWDLQQAIKDLRASQDLATVGNMATGSAGVLPIELNDAAHAGDTLSGVGSVLSTAGMLGSAWSAARPTGAVVAPAARQAVVSPAFSWSDPNKGLWTQVATPAKYDFFTGRMQ